MLPAPLLQSLANWVRTLCSQNSFRTPPLATRPIKAPLVS